MTGAPADRRADLRVPGALLIVTVVVVLAAANLVDRFVDSPASYLAVPLAAVVVTVLARRAGISWDELGLDRATWGRGARWAGVIGAVVLVAVLTVAVIPVFRDAFTDDRYDNGIGRALLTALVLIPLRTVIAEELAFRGVLLALFRRRVSTRAAVVCSSLLFGAWHITSSLGLASDNDAVGSLGSETAAKWLGVLGAVAVTTVAGVVLCWIRLRSGSLIASIGAHWAVNGAGVIAVAVVTASS